MYLLIYSDQVENILENLRTIQSQISRSKVLDLINAMQQGRSDKIGKIENQIYDVIPRQKLSDVKAAIGELTGENPARWYMIADLWDYVPE